MELNFITGTLLNVTPEQVICTTCHLLNFIHLAHYETHTDETLQKLEQSWEKFTQAKKIFLSKGIWKNFKIPKIHSIQHYMEMVHSHGTVDGYNMEASEHLHIDLAKVAYESSNKCDYIPQIKEWLMWCESIAFPFFHLVLTGSHKTKASPSIPPCPMDTTNLQ